MGGGSHAHDAHGHDAHGHDAHGHGGHGAIADPHGGEIPAVPATRTITPAPEDFAALPGPRAILWPVVWLAVAAVLVGVLLCGGWHPFHGAH
jgi:NADH-quinone oxidoreductase subunit L